MVRAVSLKLQHDLADTGVYAPRTLDLAVPSIQVTLRPRASLVKLALLVEDEESLRRTIRRYLERRGWLVIEATSAEMALEIMAADTPSVDVVLIDMSLPGLSGGELCGQIKALHPTMVNRIIVASGDAFAATRALEREQIRCPILAKPFELAELDQLFDGIITATDVSA
jgi:DNA-binding response OmpR family regulator